MSTREIEYRKQIEALSQEDLVTILCATVSAIDDEHLDQAIAQMGDDDLGSLIAKGILQTRVREDEEVEELHRIAREGFVKP